MKNQLYLGGWYLTELSFMQIKGTVEPGWRYTLY